MKNKGFSLVEVIASLAILGIGMVGILSMSSMNIKSSQYNSESLIALNLLQRKIEEVKSKIQYINFGDNITETNSSYPNYSEYMFNVTQSSSWLGNPFLQRIAISISWKDYSGTNKQIDMYILDADYDK